MSLPDRFIKYIHENSLFQKKDKLLLAVSGGADSAALCELCNLAEFDFDIAHCNFQLRDTESDRDEDFVKKLGTKYNVTVLTKRFDTKRFALENNISIQVAARQLRYNWFSEKVRGMKFMNSNVEEDETKKQYDFVVTAHHANDNIETLLMNFFKGTGIKGLEGILPRQGKITRPLLFAKRIEIENFLEERNLAFVEDSSNLSDKYTRNYFRNQLVPSIEKVFPKVEDNLVNNLERFKEIRELYEQAISIHKKKLLERNGNEIHIPVLKLLKSHPQKTILFEIIKEFGFTSHQTGEVVELLRSESGKYVLSPTHRIIRNRSWLTIAPVSSIESRHILIEEKDKKVFFERGSLEFKIHEINNGNAYSKIENTATVDLSKIEFPLLLRKWKQGDYFYPMGMKKKKKLGRFLSDKKLSVTEKENVWVLESRKKIVWVVGQRIDDRVKVTGQTKLTLTIHFKES